MQIQSSELPSLAYFGDKYDEAKYVPVSTSYGRKLKPNWGFWASPLIDDDTTSWTQYCKDNRFKGKHLRPTIQNVTVDDNAKVFAIETVDDALYLQERYEWSWENMAKDFDGVYVADQAVWVMREGYWELPSIVFFNTRCFTLQ